MGSEFLSLQTRIGAEPSLDVSPFQLEMAAAVVVPEAPWSGGKPGQCHDNVLDMIRRHGGDQVYGWALAEYGPFTTRGWYPPPLYRRWVNHVVWCDPCGNLWEVSPSVTHDDQEKYVFRSTEFLPDASAMFGRGTPQDWFRTGTRYVSLRQEGDEAAKYLTIAHAARSQDEMADAIRQAVNAVGVAGFQPKKVTVQHIGGNNTSIWIYAD
jgi:hypothetical protein